jgi:hypothetical protein
MSLWETFGTLGVAILHNWLRRAFRHFVAFSVAESCSWCTVLVYIILAGDRLQSSYFHMTRAYIDLHLCLAYTDS